MNEEVYEGLHELITQTIEKTGDHSGFVFDSILTLVKLLEAKNVLEYDEYVVALKSMLERSLKE